MGVPISMPGIHLPKRKGKEGSSTVTKVIVQSIDGTLRRISEKELLLQVSTSRTLRFRLIAKTEFRGKDGKPVRDSLLKPGDRLTIDTSPDDPETAVHATLIRPGSPAEREAAGVPVDPAKISVPAAGDLGKSHTSTEAAAYEATETDEPESGPSSESGRPALHREPPATTPREAAPEPARQPAAPTAVDAVPAPRPARANTDDDLIADARVAAAEYSAGLPNFLADQITTRFQGSRSAMNWQKIDIVTAEVTSVDGQEDYRNIQVNGIPTKNPERTGAWSTGEFQITLQDVMAPSTGAVFKPYGEDRIAGRPALVYSYSVTQKNSHWMLRAPSGRDYAPAYKGMVWIDRDTHKTLRVEQEAIDMPKGSAYDKAECMVEYGYSDIEGKRYLLPRQSINMICLSGHGTCARNVVDFKNFRKFSADSSIKF